MHVSHSSASSLRRLWNVDGAEAWDDQTGNIQNQYLNELSEDESSLAPAPEGEIGNRE